MNVILVEDELSARQNMLAIFEELDININVMVCLESIEEAVKWIESNPKPELGFFDIQLADGVSFEIFTFHMCAKKLYIGIKQYSIL
jgi:DNA-binding LytR/AlgR family response regulator